MHLLCTICGHGPCVWIYDFVCEQFVVLEHVCDLFVVTELLYAYICVICMHIWCCDATDVGFDIYISAICI